MRGCGGLHTCTYYDSFPLVMDSDRDVRGPIIVPRGDRMIGMDRDRGRSKSNGRRRGQPGDRPRQHGNHQRVCTIHAWELISSSFFHI